MVGFGDKAKSTEVPVGTIVRLMVAAIHPVEGAQPVKVYSSSGSCLNTYHKKWALFEQRFQHVLPELLTLRDLILLCALKAYNAAGGKARASWVFGFVKGRKRTKQRDNRETLLLFSGSHRAEMEVGLDAWVLYAVFAAYRPLLSLDELGSFRWVIPYSEVPAFVNSTLGVMLRKVYADHGVSHKSGSFWKELVDITKGKLADMRIAPARMQNSPLKTGRARPRLKAELVEAPLAKYFSEVPISSSSHVGA